MNVFHNPEWIREYIYNYENIDDIPPSVYTSINNKIDLISGELPLVSIILAVWNEEAKLLSTISSLVNNKTKIPFEIIIINNNSTDRTQEVVNKLHVKSLMQPIQGCGPARQLGIEHARGKYSLLVDADCIYPEDWIEGMVNALTKPGVACAYGRYSFISNEKTSRLNLFIFEKLKDIMAEIKHFKRPYLNALGMCMGFNTQDALKVGFIMHNIRGDDGRLCFDLMQFGKITQVKENKLRVWTGTRTLDNDGGFFKVLRIRITRELKAAFSYLKRMPPHDTKTSKN